MCQSLIHVVHLVILSKIHLKACGLLYCLILLVYISFLHKVDWVDCKQTGSLLCANWPIGGYCRI